MQVTRRFYVRNRSAIYPAHTGQCPGTDPIKILSTTNKKLAHLIKGVPTVKLRKRPAPEKWSVAEILADLADVEIVIGWRMRSILGDPGTPVQA